MSRAPLPEQPILWLGVAGFDVQQRIALERSLPRADDLPRWRICEFGEADAWWVDGSQARLLQGGNLAVDAQLASEAPVTLNLAEVDRPVAFARPLASSQFEPLCTFDPQSRSSVSEVLDRFDQWLRGVRSQFVLGGQIIRRGTELRHGIFHLNHRGNLLAVLDFRKGRAFLAPQLDPDDLAVANWERRPLGAGEAPPSFLEMTTAQLAWAYVRRSEHNMLPPAYCSEIIYYRRAPRVPPRCLRDSQLMLLRELAAAPGTLDSLARRTHLSRARVEHDLSCLFYASAITTTRAKAAGPVGAHNDSRTEGAFSMPSMLPESMPLLDQPVDLQLDLTAPAVRLNHRRPSAVARSTERLSPAAFDSRFR